MNLLERIFQYIDLNTDPLFILLKKQLYELLNTLVMDRFRIVLGQRFLDVEDLKDIDNVVIAPEDEASYNISIYIDSDNYSYIFEVIGSEVSFNGHYYDEDLLFNCESYEYKDGALTKIIEKIDRNDYYYDYSVQIVSLDDKGNIIRNKEDEENQIFCEKFGVPIEEAKRYRRHFKEYVTLLNIRKVKREMDGEDNLEENKYLFSVPLMMDEFASLFDYDFDINQEHLLEAIGGGYTLEDLDLALKRINALKQIIASQIGMDGQIVLENNLCVNMASYVYNSSCAFLLTKGIMIKKVNGEFTLYLVQISSSSLEIIDVVSSREQIRAMFYKNEGNEENIELKEFLEIERNRRS